MDSTEHQNPWDELSRRLSDREASPFFDHLFDEMVNLYRSLNYPNGPSLDNCWAWCYERLQAARLRALLAEEEKRAELNQQWKQARRNT